jgi:hypothetical protein
MNYIVHSTSKERLCKTKIVYIDIEFSREQHHNFWTSGFFLYDVLQDVFAYHEKMQFYLIFLNLPLKIKIMKDLKHAPSSMLCMWQIEAADTKKT